jgi:CIC family chloride channel protein
LFELFDEQDDEYKANVIDPKTNQYIGLIHIDDIRAYLFDPNLYDTILVEELIDPSIPTVSLEQELSEVIEMFDYRHDATLPVVHDKRFIGFVYKSKILDHYRKELIVEEEI